MLSKRCSRLCSSAMIVSISEGATIASNDFARVLYAYGTAKV